MIFSYIVKIVSTSSRSRGIGRFCEIMTRLEMRKMTFCGLSATFSKFMCIMTLQSHHYFLWAVSIGWVSLQSFCENSAQTSVKVRGAQTTSFRAIFILNSTERKINSWNRWGFNLNPDRDNVTRLFFHLPLSSQPIKRQSLRTPAEVCYYTTFRQGSPGLPRRFG